MDVKENGAAASAETRAVREMRIRREMEDVLIAARKHIDSYSKKMSSEVERGKTSKFSVEDMFTLEVVSDFFINALKTIPSERVSTMATDGSRILYGPSFLMKLYEEAGCALMASDAKNMSGLFPGKTLAMKGFSENEISKVLAAAAEEGRCTAEHKPSNGMPYAKSRAEAWFRAFVAVRSDMNPEEALSLAGELSAAFDATRVESGHFTAGRQAVMDFIETTAWVLVHEALHVVMRDVPEGGRSLFTNIYVRTPDPALLTKHVSAASRLHEIYNIASDSVINDTILNGFGGRLPEWCVKRENARREGVRFVYDEAVHESCVAMSEATGEPYERPKHTYELNERFVELFVASRKKQQEMIDSGFGQQQDQQQSGGSQSQQQSGGSQSQQQSGGSQGQQQNGGSQGQQQSGGSQGQQQSGGSQGQQQSGGSQGQQQSGGSQGQGMPEGGWTKDSIKDKLDWRKYNDVDPDRNVQKGMAKVFGGEVPELSNEPPEPSDDEGDGRGGEGGPSEDDAPKLPGGQKAKPSKSGCGIDPMDDHGQSGEERRKSEELDGEDPMKESGKILEDTVKKHAEESPGRLAGTGSLLASILLELLDEKKQPKRTFVVEMEAFMRKAFSPLLKKKFGAPTPLATAVNIQMEGTEQSTATKRHYRPKNVGHVVFAIDVSGSMGNEDVRAAALETASLMEKVRPGHFISIVQMDGGIVGWDTFRTGSPAAKEFLEKMFAEGFDRRGAGGTVYEPFFDVMVRAQSKKETQYGDTVPEFFVDKEGNRKEGVPKKVRPADAIIFASDGGFNPSRLPILDVGYFGWICIPESEEKNFPQVRQGKLFDASGVAVREDPLAAHGRMRFDEPSM